MLAQLVRFIIPTKRQAEAAETYATLVEQSRNPLFFSDYGVPDTLDGRFEMTLLFVFMKLQYMKQNGIGEDRQQGLAEFFFDDMDRSLRELGIADTGLKRRIRKMVEAFYGRMEAYRTAWEADDTLVESLRRNLYGTVDADDQPTDETVAKLINTLRTSDLSA